MIHALIKLANIILLKKKYSTKILINKLSNNEPSVHSRLTTETEVLNNSNNSNIRSVDL